MSVSKHWAKALRVAFLCVGLITIALTVVDIAALFYLYSFDRDPNRWTNVSAFYAQPKQTFANRQVPDPDRLASLVVRGNNGHAAYASQHKMILSDIKPSPLHDCLLAAEDKRFYRHTGLDYVSFPKLLYDYFVKGEKLRGGSTISNQVIGEVILADRSREGLRAFLRKIEEIILTNVAERHFSKDDLFLSYVNNVPVGHIYGRALIGLSAASEDLFGKRDLKTLTLSEACALSGMLNRPNRYIEDALKGDYRRIRKKRNIVLDNLRRFNPDRYSDEAIERAKGEVIRFFKDRKRPAPVPRHLISYAHQQLGSMKPGLSVYLSADQDLQGAAEHAVNAELDRFDRGPFGFYNQLSFSHAIKQGRKIAEEESKLQAALVALDAKTGEVLALVGGRNSAGEFNRAMQAKRAPGSVIKPFVYLYGINSGFLNGQPFRADTIIDPSMSAVAQRYTTGGAARATVQLARSDNGAAVALAQEFGISRVRDFIAKVTGTNPATSELLAIGAGKGIELSPLQMASAYTIFPNDGVKAVPNPIVAVYDNDTRIKLPEQKPVRLIDAGAPHVVVRMLQSVVGDDSDGEFGTAKMARQLSGLDHSVKLAGKTGTGDNDLWFVGFTPRIVVVVWVGFDNNFPPFESSKGFTGSGLPLQIWARFMKDVKKYRPDLLSGKFDV